jgi:hypothetical protein
MFARTARAGVLVAALATTAEAQVLQDGDIVVGGNDPALSVGRIYRVRAGAVDVLATCGRFPGMLILDQAGRVVFTTVFCGGNSNSVALNRLDPETGQIELLACFPYIATPANIPPGLPPDATSLSGVRGLHETRSLRISIDDDVNGGVPQVSTLDAYGLSIGVVRGATPSIEAFRYVEDEGTFEGGIGLAALRDSQNGALMVGGNGGTYYSDGERIGRAGPDLKIAFHFNTIVLDNPLSFGGSLTLAGQNEIVVPAGILDNTRFPNVTAQCGALVDDDVPLESSGAPFKLFGAAYIGLLGGSLCAVSDSGSTGVPYLFDIAERPPFLNPYVCTYYEATRAFGPHDFFQVPLINNFTSDGARILGGDDSFPGKLYAVTQSGATELATNLTRPRGAAAYPPPEPALGSAVLVLRIDAGNADDDAPPPMNLVVIDAAGRRLGRQPDGTPVNDFGDRAAALELGPNGRIRMLALQDPSPGRYMLFAVGTAQGAYEVRGYLADTSAGGTMVMRSGSTGPGILQGLTAMVTGPTGLTLSKPKTFRIR